MKTNELYTLYIENGWILWLVELYFNKTVVTKRNRKGLINCAPFKNGIAEFMQGKIESQASLTKEDTKYVIFNNNLISNFIQQ